MARAETTSRQAIQSMRAVGSVLGTNYTFLHLAQAQLMRGHIREANALFREASMMAEDNFGAESSLKALCSTFMAHWCYVHGDMEAAGKLIESSFQTTDGWVDVFVSGYEVRARLAFARGGIADAIDVISEAVRTARDRHLDRLGAIAAAWRVEFLALAGHVRDARREAQAAGVFAAAALRGPPDFNWRPRLASTIAIARLHIAAGETAQALLLLNTASAEFRNGDLTLCAYRLDALATIALNRRGDIDEAIGRLQSLLEFVVAEGASGLLIEQGSGLVSLLHVIQRKNHELVVSGMQRDVVANVLATLQRQHLSTQSGFSARELDVLRELCHGRSNKSIGQMLDLSENTVKFHLKRIFRKLGADSRAGAIAAALQRNLVDLGEAPKKPIRP